LNRLDEEAAAGGESLKGLENLLQDKRVQLANTPSIWPARGWFTSGFGYRISPFTGLRQMHEGIDISNRIGSPAYAPGDGLVTNIGREWGFGKILVISHGFGITTRYGHLSKINVKIGQKVKRGQKIAEIGSTGRSTGPHLHYEVKVNGVPVNPLKYILN
jgi:murein DD-endopeptidase MepM/ murein hydrolase activator NlpD